MKTREIACIHYKCQGSCALGKDADFYGHCQTCRTYSALPHGRPARIDTRKQRAERARRKEKFDY